MPPMLEKLSNNSYESVPELGPLRIEAAPYFRRKTVLIRFIALLLLVPALPLTCVLVMLVRLTSKGPAIYRQVRSGKDGRSFTMYKLRSMRLDAELSTGPVWCQEDDPRVTPVGRFLRDHHLDEIPQLFNIVRGEMDLFGPRPERPEFTAILSKEIPLYMERLKVLPGITGLAQINLPPDTDLASVRRKLKLDIEYIQNASLGMDLRMFCATLSRLFGVSGPGVLRLTRLYRPLNESEGCRSETTHSAAADGRVAE